MADAPRLAGLVVEETSGVDHPAHMREGWVVMKGATATQVAEVLGRVAKEEFVPEKLSASSVEDELRAQVSDLTTKLAAATAPPKPAEPTDEDLIKSAPEPVRKALEHAQAVAKAAEDRAKVAEAEVNKARELAEDAVAIEKAAGWKGLALDAQTVGPALRKLAGFDAVLAKSIDTALTAANAQAETGDLFKSVGSTGTASQAAGGGTGLERLEAIAKAAVDSGIAKSFSQAMADAASANPDLYKQHLTERG
jgi:hypothetical protein